ncbi:MAG: hypothetical protein H7321_08725 [Bacteroidia bacterium]|nr:hypothetical protein [Bacteroidia bacterium]
MSDLKTLPESMAQMKSLKILGIIPTKFTSIPPVLYKMTWLEEVEIGNEEWWPTDEELEPLRKVLKKTKVN